MVAAVVSPTNSQASSSTIRKLAPSPRDAPLLKQRQPLTALPSQSPRNNRDGGGATMSPRALSPSINAMMTRSGDARINNAAMMDASTTSPRSSGKDHIPPLHRSRWRQEKKTNAKKCLSPPPPLLLPVERDEDYDGNPPRTTSSLASPKTTSAFAFDDDAGQVVESSSPRPPPPPSPNHPVAAVAAATSPPPTMTMTTTTIGSRSKRMLVIDPKSGRKHDLRADDHSLTDMELHVYHRGNNNVSNNRKPLPSDGTSTARNASVRNPSNDPAGSRRRHPPPLLTAPEEEDDDEIGGRDHDGSSALMQDSHTLNTASALTEVSYRIKGNDDGHCRCVGTTLGDLADMILLGGGEDRAVTAMLDGEGVVGGLAAEAEERRDDVECAERDIAEGAYPGTTRPGEVECEPGMLSPISKALSTAMITPIALLSGLAGRFSFCGINNENGNDGNGGMVVETRIRRVCMVLFPEELRSCLEGSAGVGLLGMKFHQYGGDFQAHVRWIQRGSKAERMGVRVGDVVSFAVALSNMTEEENTFLAEKLIKRLEAVGMRTSYRELYDIFLSKTTNTRPIGLVFRRRAKGGGAGLSSSPRTASVNSITNEFEWSTDFLQSLSIKCREYEFDQKVPFSTVIDLEEEGSMGHKLVSFLPPPNVDTSSGNLLTSDYLNDTLDSWKIGYNCSKTSPMMACIDSPFGAGLGEVLKSEAANNDFLSNRVLCSLVEQSMGLIFIRQSQNEDKVTTGSGFAVVRKSEGSWSAPCFLTILGSKDEYVNGTNASHPSQFEDVKMIIIRNTAMVLGLISGTAVKLSTRKDERANVLVRDAAIIGLHEGRFQLARDFFVAVKANEVQNQGAYNLLSNPIEASDILTGAVSPPEQSVDFYGALQSLELPYSMHSHPVLPDVLQRYSDNDWVEFLPDLGSIGSSCGMRSKLAMVSKRDSSAEVQREIDIFARKFKYYLMDGVPVMRVLSTKSNSSMEEKVLRLTVKDPRSIFSSSLELLRRRKPGVSNVGIPNNFSTTFEAITKLSRTPPKALSGLDEEEKKRFFSFETDLSPGPIMMLAKSKKDAMLLLCGLKLLLEREKMASDPN
ncbi:hypothetical protein ACHAXA_007951 [Cyclostephanos tholiformis]|uniref:Uncharacterized protein n=1 Tax=Cyclostephanos tholiformis TaxID=382380 RepID=A0ABD3R7G9_9STRA